MDSDVTLLLTDIEGSTDLWARYPEAMEAALAKHHRILQSAIRRHGGNDFKDTGDGQWGAFDDAADALCAAVEMQRELMDATYDGGVPTMWVRIGLHTGRAIPRGDNDFCGAAVNLTARVSDAAHGGQAVSRLARRSRVRRTGAARDAASSGTPIHD